MASKKNTARCLAKRNVFPSVSSLRQSNKSKRNSTSPFTDVMALETHVEFNLALGFSIVYFFFVFIALKYHPKLENDKKVNSKGGKKRANN